LKRSKRRSRLGTFLFLLPFIIIVAVVVFAIVDVELLSTGTLVVSASRSGTYESPIPLAATATVNGATKTTPFNVTLSQGNYEVDWGALPWYTTPPPSQAVVVSGKVSFAAATYDPIVRHLAIAGHSFNATTVTAGHGVTPVVWVNGTGQDEIHECPQYPNQDIPPHQTYALVFPSAGSFTFSLLQGTSHVSVTVS
jgi:hypothetical protein